MAAGSNIESLRSNLASMSLNRSYSSPSVNAAPPDYLHTVDGISEEMFVNKVDDQFWCVYCTMILRWPMQAGCGCRACYGCLYRHNRSQTGPDLKCSHCGDTYPREDMMKDNYARRELEKSKVYCENKEIGCVHIMLLKDLDTHLQDECEYEAIQCIHHAKGCNQKLPRNRLVEHLESECPYRRSQCKYCDGEIMALDLEAHEAKCLNYVQLCPNNCDMGKFHRDNLQDHIDNVCPLQKHKCMFSDYGCNVMEMRVLLAKHMTSNQVEHLEMINMHINGMNEKLANLMNIESQLTGQSIKSLAQKNEKQLRELQRTLAPKFDKLIQVEESMSRIPKQESIDEIKDCVKGLQSHDTKFESRMTSMEQQMKEILPVELSKAFSGGASVHYDNATELQSYDGTLLWKIKDFSRRKRDADSGKTLSLYSPAFYTSQYGYKMCARIYLNGDGMGKKTHISLFFVVKKGDHDALLTWPFRPKVTLMLLDQKSGRMHLTDSFKPDPTSSSFQRPTTDMNIASGCPLFVSQSVLSETAYVNDNIMFIKIIVDTTDVVKP